jgi:hypothetical protein
MLKISAITATLFVAVSAAISANAASDVTKITIPFTGNFIVSNSGVGCNQSDFISSWQTGSEVHVVAIVKPKFNSIITITFVDVVRIGSSGETYTLMGSHKYPDQGVISAKGFSYVSLPLHDYELVHTTDGCADTSFDPSFLLEFLNGKLQKASLASSD